MLQNVWSLYECWVCAHKMLIKVVGGIFLPSDLYQVQDHGWVIWLIEALLLQSSGCSGNDRPALQHLWTGVYPFFCLQLILLECLFRLIPWMLASPGICSSTQDGDKLSDAPGARCRCIYVHLGLTVGLDMLHFGSTIIEIYKTGPGIWTLFYNLMQIMLIPIFIYAWSQSFSRESWVLCIWPPVRDNKQT